MNRVIILEGPDGGGKTTLAEVLRREHGFRIEHTGPPPAGSTGMTLFQAYADRLWRALTDDQPVVFDRHYLGELVYGPIMRGGSLLTATHVRLLERLIRAHDVKVVCCLPAWKLVRDNWVHKQADYVPSEGKLLAVYESYCDHHKACNWHRYDYAHPANAKDFLFKPRPTLPPHVLGSPTARLLLVGEQVNINKTRVDLPFFEDGGCSAHLDEAVRLADISEDDLALVNAVNPAGAPHDLRPVLSRFTRPPHVVALGQVAHRELNLQGVTHDTLNHPQYHKRFCTSLGVADYARQLKEVYDALPAHR